MENAHRKWEREITDLSRALQSGGWPRQLKGGAPRVVGWGRLLEMGERDGVRWGMGRGCAICWVVLT